jgi:flagellar motor switch protein FliN/FliY
MNNEAKKKCANLFASGFAECLAESLATLTGQQWPLEVANAPDAASSQGTPVHLRLLVEGALSGECFAEFYESQVAEIAAKAGQQPSADSAEEPGETLARFIGSAMQGLAACISSKFGAVTIKVERVAGLAFGGMFVVPLATAPGTQNLQALLYFGPKLLDALTATQDAGQAAAVENSAISPKNLKLVMDVELNVSLRFGQRQMPLREVLELASGSVVELDRMVDEPVELLLDGKMIARGEAVVVDGNYGLRVTEIPQPVVSHFLN